MTRTWFLRSGVVAVLGLVAFLAYSHGVSRRMGLDDQSQRRLHMLEEFCQRTRFALIEDRAAFLGGDEEAREVAISRFHEGNAMYHNQASVALCHGGLDGIPVFPAMCWLQKEWQCLAGFAAELERLVR